MDTDRRDSDAVCEVIEEPWRYRSTQRTTPRLPLPLPIAVRVGDDDCQAFCRDIGADSLGIEIKGATPQVGDEISVRLWVAGKSLDASAWVLRAGKTIGLRCPRAGEIYQVLGGKIAN